MHSECFYEQNAPDSQLVFCYTLSILSISLLVYLLLSVFKFITEKSCETRKSYEKEGNRSRRSLIFHLLHFQESDYLFKR
jgi:hypothetical protein